MRAACSRSWAICSSEGTTTSFTRSSSGRHGRSRRFKDRNIAQGTIDRASPGLQCAGFRQSRMASSISRSPFPNSPPTYRRWPRGLGAWVLTSRERVSATAGASCNRPPMRTRAETRTRCAPCGPHPWCRSSRRRSSWVSHRWLSSPVHDAYVKERMRIVASGPPSYTDENTLSGNRARNTAFELAIGARIVGGGLQLAHSVPSDVAVRLATRTVIIECKRVCPPLAASCRLVRERM